MHINTSHLCAYIYTYKCIFEKVLATCLGTRSSNNLVETVKSYARSEWHPVLPNFNVGGMELSVH